MCAVFAIPYVRMNWLGATAWPGYGRPGFRLLAPGRRTGRPRPIQRGRRRSGGPALLLGNRRRWPVVPLAARGRSGRPHPHCIQAPWPLGSTRSMWVAAAAIACPRASWAWDQASFGLAIMISQVTSATGAKRTLKKATLLRHADIPSGSACRPLSGLRTRLSVVGEDASVDHHGVERMFVQEDGEVRKDGRPSATAALILPASCAWRRCWRPEGRAR